jgi:hypothetical protein
MITFTKVLHISRPTEEFLCYASQTNRTKMAKQADDVYSFIGTNKKKNSVA